jgi:hypothetical protein
LCTFQSGFFFLIQTFQCQALRFSFLTHVTFFYSWVYISHREKRTSDETSTKKAISFSFTLRTHHQREKRLRIILFILFYVTQMTDWYAYMCKKQYVYYVARKIWKNGENLNTFLFARCLTSNIIFIFSAMYNNSSCHISLYTFHEYVYHVYTQANKFMFLNNDRAQKKNQFQKFLYSRVYSEWKLTLISIYLGVKHEVCVNFFHFYLLKVSALIPWKYSRAVLFIFHKPRKPNMSWLTLNV